MWNYITNVPSVLKGKSSKAQKVGIEVANRALAQGKTEAQALMLASIAANMCRS